MAREVHIIKNQITGLFILNPFRKERREFSDWASAQKVLIEENIGRKLKLITNIENNLIEELEKELKIIEIERLRY